MKKLLRNPIKTINIVCVLLMTVLVLMQFLPFWTVEGETISVMHYMGFPDEHNNLTSWLDDTVAGGFAINNLVGWFFFTVALSIVGAVLCIKNWDKPLAGLLPGICGVVGIAYCVSEPAFRLGQTWVVQLLLYILLLALAACDIVVLVKKIAAREK